MRTTSRPRALAPAALAAGSVIVAVAIGYVIGAFLPVTTAKESPKVAWWLAVLAVAAFLIAFLGCTVALAWWTRRVQGTATLRIRNAIAVGIISGLLAAIIAWILEDQTHLLPGWLGGSQGGDLLAGFIEEAAKLALPVILMGTIAFRHTLTGFWAVFVSAATFGFVEGAMGFIGGIYDPNPPTPGYTSAWVEAINALNITGEVHHVLYTAPAGALIWYAATRFSTGKAALIGVLAYLGASLIHGFNDAVLAFYLDGGATAIYAAFAFGILLLFTWYSLPVRKLSPPEITPESQIGNSTP